MHGARCAYGRLRAVRLAVAIITMLSVLGVAAEARADDDLVLLNNGGQIRGLVMSEDPKEGVSVRLANGTVRKIPASDIKSVQYAGESVAPKPSPSPSAPVPVLVPNAGAGSIHVEATAPGRVLVDGSLVGPAPADVAAAAPGSHLVRVEFADGSSQQERILVQAGQISNVSIASPDSAPNFAARNGIHFGVGAAPTFVFFPGFGGDRAFGGLAASFLLDVAINPEMAFRASGFVQPMQGAYTLMPIGVSAGVHFNLSTTYTMGVGLRGGALLIAGTNGVNGGALFGPEVSVAGFRFGAKREMSVELMNRVGFYKFPNIDRFVSTPIEATFESAVGFNYLFL